MKKIFALVLAVLLFVAIPCEAFAEVPDFSAMSDEELHALINASRNELAARELIAGENVLLFDQEGVQVFMTGNNSIDDYGNSVELNIEVVIINDSEYDIALVDDSTSVNGWEVMFYGVGGVSAGKKKKAELELEISDASISTLEEVEDIEFVFQILDEDSYDVICTLDPITVVFDQ